MFLLLDIYSNIHGLELFSELQLKENIPMDVLNYIKILDYFSTYMYYL